MKNRSVRGCVYAALVAACAMIGGCSSYGGESPKNPPDKNQPAGTDRESPKEPPKKS